MLAAMTVAAMVLLPSPRARSWAKVKLAKHVFEHRYDYRTEWLRFTDTLGRTGADARAARPSAWSRRLPTFSNAPGGLLLVEDSAGGDRHCSGRVRDWPGTTARRRRLRARRRLVASARASSGRIIELDALRPRHRPGAGPACSQSRPGSPDDAGAWAGVPLIHQRRMVGLVLLAAPEYRRPLDWEDFDLLRTAGRQAASSLAEAHGQDAPCPNAQRFEEFNRRFAFILHDIKNLVSQLSLLTRNAERHADNAEFRADMIATLKSSVGKMNDLLARLVAAGDGAGRAAPSRAAARHPLGCGDRRQAPSHPSPAARRCTQLGAIADAAGARAGGRPSSPERGRGQPERRSQ